MPETAFDGFLEALGNLTQGGGIIFLDEFPDRCVLQIGFEQLVEMMVRADWDYISNSHS